MIYHDPDGIRGQNCLVMIVISSVTLTKADNKFEAKNLRFFNIPLCALSIGKPDERDIN